MGFCHSVKLRAHERLNMASDKLYTILKECENPTKVPNLKHGPAFVIQKSGATPAIPMVRVREEGTNKTVLVQTASFTMTRGPMKTDDGNYVFPRSVEEAPSLASIIEKLEAKANETLVKEAGMIEGLPERLRRTLVKDDGQLLRPIFNASGKAYFKPSTDCKIYDWLGKRVMKEELGPGRYQLLLRADKLYIGPHGKTDYPASLQAKVWQIRYDPDPELEENAQQGNNFMFQPEFAHDYSVNNLPPNQMHAIQLGFDTDDDSHPTSTPRKRRHVESSNLIPIQPVSYSPASASYASDENAQWIPHFLSSQHMQDPALWNSHL